MYYNNYEIEMMHKAKREDQLRVSLSNNKIKENRKNIIIISSLHSFLISNLSLNNLFSNLKKE